MSMTVEEAIQRLKQEARNKRADADWKWRHGRLNSDDLIESAESMEQLAKWLEEIQQYRAIGLGSPEEVEQDLILYKADREVLREFEAIGTVDRFRELEERATAKSMKMMSGVYGCCSCGLAYAVRGNGYCINCGQHLYEPENKEEDVDED